MLSTAMVVVCALDLLGRSHAAAPIALLPYPPPGASANAEAFVTYDPPTIYLITSTAAFREAQQGSIGRPTGEGCRKIASIIAHEEWHLRHGADEEGAYLAQLTTLMALGASSQLVATVRQSMMAVTKSEKRRHPAPVVGRVARRDD